ncbi:unnamed protein product, partial [Allacma fusca]
MNLLQQFHINYEKPKCSTVKVYPNVFSEIDKDLVDAVVEEETNAATSGVCRTLP